MIECGSMVEEGAMSAWRAMIRMILLRMTKIGEDGGGGVMGVSGKLTFSKKVEAAIDKKVLAQLEIAVTRSFG